jgi:hypothetical protein
MEAVHEQTLWKNGDPRQPKGCWVMVDLLLRGTLTLKQRNSTLASKNTDAARLPFFMDPNPAAFRRTWILRTHRFGEPAFPLHDLGERQKLCL